MKRRSGAKAVLKLTTALLAVIGLWISLGTATVGAHPLGNATVNRYRGLVVAPDGVSVDYVMDLAEIPTVQARQAIEQAGGTTPYGTQRCRELAGGLELTLNGSRTPLQPVSDRAELLSGQGGLQTLRLSCEFRTGADVTVRNGSLSFADTNEPDRPGWQEITLLGQGVVLRSDLPTRSSSQRLTSYPTGEEAPLPQLRSGQADLEVVDPDASLPSMANGTTETAPAVENTPAGTDRLAGLISGGDQGRWAMLAALAVAAGLGALHGLAPGHGKTVVAAYLVGTRGNRPQAATLAGIIALSHTSGVFILGGLTLAASATFPVLRVHAWLRLTSAMLVLGLGLWMVIRLLAARRHHRPVTDHAHGAGHHHHHPHPHAADLHHDLEHHDLEPASGQQAAAASVLALASAGSRRDTVDYRDTTLHSKVQSALHERPLPEPHDHADHADHEHRRSGGHRHGLVPHRHNVAWDQLDTNQPLQWRSLLLLGLAGGLVPSASAVIVLLGAVQLGRLAFGAALIVAFGLGLAAALVGVGLGVVTLSRRGLSVLDQRAWAEGIQRNLAPAACIALLVVGAWLTYRAVSTF